MRKITRNLVTLVFIIIAYFAFSTWINWLTESKGNTNLVKIMTPFQLIILGLLFAMIIPTFKSIFMASIIGMRRYQKNKADFLLYDYDKIHTILNSMRNHIDKNSLAGIKKDLGNYYKIIVKPQFVTTLANDLRTAAIKEISLIKFSQVVREVLVSFEEFYQKEHRVAIGVKKKSIWFDFKRGYEMTSQGSRYNINYYEVLYNQTQDKRVLGWKIFSLNMFKFYLYLATYGLGITSCLAIIFFPIIAVYSNFNLARWGAIIYIMSVGLITMTMHFLKSLKNTAKLHEKQYLIVPALVYYSLILLVLLNMCLAIIAMPAIDAPLNDTGADILQSGPLPYLLSIGYLVLSTALLLYVIATLMDCFRSNGLSWGYLIEGIILPGVIWISVSITKLLVVVLFNNNTTTNSNSIIGYVTIILFTYWMINWASSGFVSTVVEGSKIISKNKI